jgi:peptide deformylase
MSDSPDPAAVREEQPLSPEGPGDDAVAELDPQTRERRAAALAHVRTFGDPVLKSLATKVTSFGPELEREAEQMVAIMRDALGVGLAATQLGIMHRLLVVQAGLDATPTAIVNPELEWLSDDLAIALEGCLSLPGITVEVERPLHARVRGRDVHGESLMVEASGLEARVLQHEIDHLDGVLILDRTEREQRKGALRALREGTTYSPASADDSPADDSSATPARPASPDDRSPSAPSSG